MSNIILQINTSIFIQGNDPHKNVVEIFEKRVEQYVVGLQKLFMYNKTFLEHKIDIVFTDNTYSDKTSIPQEILKVIPDNVVVMCEKNNKYGRINKGAGLIESWRFIKNIIKNYDFLIYFEPRQLLENFDFFDLVIKKPDNYFKTLQNMQVYTGLFCISVPVLINYIDHINLDLYRESIERDIFVYLVNINNNTKINNTKINNTKINNVDKLNLIRFVPPENYIEYY